MSHPSCVSVVFLFARVRSGDLLIGKLRIKKLEVMNAVPEFDLRWLVCVVDTNESPVKTKIVFSLLRDREKVFIRLPKVSVRNSEKDCSRRSLSSPKTWSSTVEIDWFTQGISSPRSEHRSNDNAKEIERKKLWNFSFDREYFNYWTPSWWFAELQFSLKKLVVQPHERNNDRTKELRHVTPFGWETPECRWKEFF